LGAAFGDALKGDVNDATGAILAVLVAGTVGYFVVRVMGRDRPIVVGCVVGAALGILLAWDMFEALPDLSLTSNTPDALSRKAL
jgi:hypothetical protein